MKFNFKYMDTKRMSNEDDFANLARGRSQIYGHKRFDVFQEKDKAVRKPVSAPVPMEPRPLPPVNQQVSESDL